VIFQHLYSILTSIKATNVTERSGKTTTGLATVGGLVLVWTIVWANLPSKEEFLSAQSASATDEMPRSPELDLAIPGVSSESLQNPAKTTDTSSVTTTGGLSVPYDRRARLIAEVKCEAEVQQYCPDSLEGEDRRRCVMQRIKRLDPPCQQIVRQQLVRWKVMDGYKLACAEDVRRVCQTVQPGDGRILQCLQEHEQDLSEGCYLSLPKGRLQTRN
jgi:hypothetical protein